MLLFRIVSSTEIHSIKQFNPSESENIILSTTIAQLAKKAFVALMIPLEIHVHPVGIPLRRVVALDGGVDLEPGLPVQRHRGRPRRVDVEGHPLDRPPPAPLDGGLQQRLAEALPPAALLHCTHARTKSSDQKVAAAPSNVFLDGAAGRLTCELGDGGAE